MFSLRGGVEHRKLKLSQLKRNYNPDHYVYYENVYSGSFPGLRIIGKVIPIYACPEVGEKCPVYILDTYLSKLPPKHMNLTYSTYAHCLKHPDIHLHLGMQQYRLERIPSKINSATRVSKPVSMVIRPTIVLELLVQHKCMTAVFLRN